ncbi:MAG: L-histidine N(alpha)-methyltransferase [Alphaproteobacteria bacterium]|nr:MAG: L-histidine N(alpha)-methyltransferase [Alphaproteobacteria bacterium]
MRTKQKMLCAANEATKPLPGNENFLSDTADLFLGQNRGHMGKHMYADHDGKMGDQRMSGSFLWEIISNDFPRYYVSHSDTVLIKNISGKIKEFIPCGLPFIDLGPGSYDSVANKSLALVRDLKSNIYMPVDISQHFLDEAIVSAGKSMPLLPTLIQQADFFSPQWRHGLEGEVCAFLGGSTISNLEGTTAPGTIDRNLPGVMSSLARSLRGGWLLVTYDGNESESHLRQMYEYPTNRLFILNVFFRMLEELPICHFNPTAFEYEMCWIPHEHQVAHLAVCMEDMNFLLDGRWFHLRRGQKLHLLNSYKFPSGKLESMAQTCGWSVVKTFTDDESPLCLALLRSHMA